MMLELITFIALVPATPSPIPAPNVVTVTVRGFAFERPAPIPAGLIAFRLGNNGALAHHMTIVRLDE